MAKTAVVEEVKAEKPRRVKAPARTKYPFMGDDAYEEAVRVWESEFVPSLSEAQTQLLADLSTFMRDTIGWKAFGRLVGTGDPKKS